MTIIAGLGNPGSKYAGTRHNSGFSALDILAEKNHIEVKDKKFRGLIGQGIIDSEKVLLVKPTTFMNLSGECLREVCDYYKVDPEDDLIVLYDDISLSPGQLRIRSKGSAGGHNGVKSMIACLGTDVFRRVKIGVGKNRRDGTWQTGCWAAFRKMKRSLWRMLTPVRQRRHRICSRSLSTGS